MLLDLGGWVNLQTSTSRFDTDLENPTPMLTVYLDHRHISAKYMESCSMEISPDVMQATVSSVVANGAGDTVWVTAITDQPNELLTDDEHATTVNTSKI